MGGSKGGSRSVIVGYNYFASFAGLAGLGEASELISVLVEGKVAWSYRDVVVESIITPSDKSQDKGTPPPEEDVELIFADTPIQGPPENANPFIFDIEGRGRCYWYWGTADQVLSDPVLTAEGRDHPPYRHRPILVCEDFLCGFERLSIPSIQVVYRRKADQQIITSTPATLDDGQANPLAILAEMLTSELTGAGLPPSKIDAPSWQAIADQLHQNKDIDYLSALIEDRQPALEIIEQINSYADTWFRIGPTGQIEAGRFQQFGGEFPALPILTQHDLTEPPTFLPVDQTMIDDRFELEFPNRDQWGHESIARYDSPHGREFKETSTLAKVATPWITRPDQALVKAAHLGERQATPYDNIRLSVREEILAARQLDVGSQLILNYAPDGYRALCRIIELTGHSDAGGPVRLELETERLVGPPVASQGYDLPEPTETPFIQDLTYFSIIQAPEALASGEKYHLLTLAGRTQPLTRGYNLWWRLNGSDAYNYLAAASSFAVPTELTTNLTSTGPDDDTTGTIRIREFPTPAPIGFSNLPGTQTPEEINADNLLLILVSPTDPHHYEILTITSIESPITDDYPIHARRGRLGSVKRDHNAGALAWILFRSDIALATNPGFEAIALATSPAARTINIKPLPNTATEGLTLDAATPYNLELFEQFTEVIYDGNA